MGKFLDVYLYVSPCETKAYKVEPAVTLTTKALSSFLTHSVKTRLHVQTHSAITANIFRYFSITPEIGTIIWK